jgi:hypothetical protein
MEKIVAELAAVIIRKNLTLSEAAVHVGCSPGDLYGWLLGGSEPSAFFLGVLPGVVEDLSGLYVDKE